MGSSPRSPSSFPCSTRTSTSTKSTTAAHGTILGSCSGPGSFSKVEFSGHARPKKDGRARAMRIHESLALGVPDILLPRPGTDLSKWAVIAWDQFHSEPAYGQNV